MPLAQVVGSALLGFISTAGLILLTGAGSGAGPLGILVVSSLVGVGVGAFLRLRVWPGESSGGGSPAPLEG